MNGSGARLDRPSPQVLRLLPHLKPPPARVLVLGGSGHEARALDARGYEVSVVDATGTARAGAAPLPVLALDFTEADFGGTFDLVCEVGACVGAPGPAWVLAAARALRPGGQLFGAFSTDASALMHAVSPHFDVERCLPAGDTLEVVLRRR